MNKVFITGASGFVGKNLIRYLNQMDVATFACSQSEGFNYTLIDSTLLDNQKITTLVHLAGKAHDLRRFVNSRDYYEVNTNLTGRLFDSFLQSNAKNFIYISSIKALADRSDTPLTEEMVPLPLTDYGKSKLAAEEYLLKHILPPGKRLYILRPCMIHGPGNKGNLNLLYNLASRGIPWPLGAFENKRFFCSVDNLMFIIKELIERDDILSGVYNVADDEALSINDVISILAESQNRKVKILKTSKVLIRLIAKLGDILHLPITTERLQKLTESYLVSNRKIKTAIGKSLPVSSRDGLFKTFNSFNKSAQ